MNTLDSDRSPHRVQITDYSQHEEIENEDRGRRILTSVEVAPRGDACRYIGNSHRCVVKQQRQKYIVSGIGASKNTGASDDRDEAE